MSADSFHHQVEASIKKEGKLYDFTDFENAVSKANSGKVNVRSLNYWDFCPWPDHLSAYQLQKENRPYISDMKKVVVKRGSLNLFYNLSYDNSPLEEFYFLLNRVKNGFPRVDIQRNCRGIPQAKKDDVIKKLVPLMPENRRKFWLDLVTDNVLDLIDHYDDGIEDDSDNL